MLSVQRASSCPDETEQLSQQTEPITCILSWKWCALLNMLMCPMPFNIHMWSRRPGIRTRTPEISPSPDGKTRRMANRHSADSQALPAADRSWRRRPHSSPELNWLCRRVCQEEEEVHVIAAVCDAGYLCMEVHFRHSPLPDQSSIEIIWITRYHDYLPLLEDSDTSYTLEDKLCAVCPCLFLHRL